MANIRLLYNNIADNSSSISVTTPTSQIGDFSVYNLLDDRKGTIFRANTNEGTLFTINWPSSVVVNCIALPCTNLTNNATITFGLYTGTNATGTKLNSSPDLSFGVINGDFTVNNTAYSTWSETNVNTFNYGGYSKAMWWGDNTYTGVRSCQINITDSGNLSTYLDISRIIIGEYWEPSLNIQKNLRSSIIDNSSTRRAESGDLVTSRSTVNESLDFSFSLLTEQDREDLLKIMKITGVHKNILVSVFSDATDATYSDFSIYGKRDNSSISYVTYNYYGNSMSITGW